MRLVTCYTRTPAKRAAFSQKFDCGQEESYEAVLRNPEVEAVVLVTPNNTHAEQAIQAAAHGKHIRVDKPIATTVADARVMMQACEKAGVVLSVAAPYRFMRGMRLFRKMLDEGALGVLAMAEANYSNDRGYYYTPQDWQWYSSGSPGGPLIQVAVHQIDSLYYLFGPVRRVSAMFSKVMTKSEIPDVSVLWLEFESGLLATLGTSFVSPTAKNGRFTLFLNAYGSEANLYHDRWDGLFVLRRGAQDKERVPLEEYAGQGHIQANLEDFASAVREGRSPEVGGKEGLHVLAVIRAAMRSAEAGRPIELAEILGE
jgi:predicted dehydrogenase